jgi:hypothetical protein
VRRQIKRRDNCNNKRLQGAALELFSRPSPAVEKAVPYRSRSTAGKVLGGLDLAGGTILVTGCHVPGLFGCGTSAATVLPEGVVQSIVEYALIHKEFDWRVLKAKPKEMQSSTPRPAYLPSVVSWEPQRLKYPGGPGVAEGTLFTYFKNKDDLINSLYREIKLELADAMMSDFPRKKNVRSRLQQCGTAIWIGALQILNSARH